MWLRRVSVSTAHPTLLATGTGFVEVYSTDWEGDGFRMIQAHYTYCLLCFCYYFISFTSHHWALEPRVGDPDCSRPPGHILLVGERGSEAESSDSSLFKNAWITVPSILLTLNMPRGGPQNLDRRYKVI